MANHNNIARNILILENYKWLQQLTGDAGIRIIPFKGIDLLQQYYEYCSDRECADIDVLVPSLEECERLVALLLQNGYSLQFPFAADAKVLEDKGKVSLIAYSHLQVDIDIHLRLVTKKYYASTIGSFHTDMLARCVNNRLDPLDHWLVLAQHAVFHAFTDPKWLRDMALISDSWNEEQWKILHARAQQYGMERIYVVTCTLLRRELPPCCKETLFLRRYGFRMHFIHRHICSHLVGTTLEFICIDSYKQRQLTRLHFLCPSVQRLQNMYRIPHAGIAVLFYPLHWLIALLYLLLIL